MKSRLLLTSALFLGMCLILSEIAAAQKCTEGQCAPCVVGGKKGTRCCENGKLSACIPDLDQEAPLCGSKVCAAGKVCQDRQCVSGCKPGFTDCGGFCRNLSHDSGNCGACNNVCRSGTSCQPSGGSGACGCTAPSIGCGDICRNPTNDPANCGTCGNVCTAPNTACRNSQCVPPEVPSPSETAGSTGNLPLDLFWKTTDPNGLPFNPDWRARSDPALLEGNHVNLAKACPAAVTCPPNINPRICWQQCTTFPVTSDAGFFCGTHINWVPATYDGGLEFDDYTARGFLSSVFKDDDYTFNLAPTGGAGLAGRDHLHPEMAFLETVARFQSGFWSNFRDSVDHVIADDLTAPKSLFAGRHAIVIGLQGLDTQHFVHEELHPIYAMALRRLENPITGAAPLAQDCWAIFARNWGNEGGCSSQTHHLDLDHITFHLPQPPGATAVTETFREFKTNSSVTAVSEVGRLEDGAAITITLGQSDDRTFVNGEVCLRWSLPPGAQPSRAGRAAPRPPAPPGPETDKDEEQYPGIELLTSAQLAQLKRSLPATPSRDKRLDMLVPKRVPFVPAPAHALAPAAVLRDRVGPVNVQKQARDRQIQGRICQMLRGHPKRPKICDKL